MARLMNSRRIRYLVIVSLSGVAFTLLLVLRLLYAGNQLAQIFPSALLFFLFVVVYPILRIVVPRGSPAEPHDKNRYYIRLVGTYFLIPLCVGLIYYFLPPAINLNWPNDALIMLAVAFALVFIFSGRAR